MSYKRKIYKQELLCGSKMIKTDLLIVETKDEEFLFTLGYLQGPDYFNCYPQYIPFQSGDNDKFKRRIGSKDYLKATNLLNYSSPEDYFRRIKQSSSHAFLDVDPFLGRIFRVPENSVKRIINPREMLKSIDSEPLNIVQKLSILFDVEQDNLGLIGTLAYGGAVQSSDVDIVIYGKRNSIRASHRIRELRAQKEYQLIKYGRIHHRLFNLEGRVIDPHFVLNPNEQSLLQEHSFTYEGEERLEDGIKANIQSCFTPAIYQTKKGYFVTYAIGHRMLLDVGTAIDLPVKVFEGTHKDNGKKDYFYLWQMEKGWIDPTKEKRFKVRFHDVPRRKNVARI